MQRGELSGRQCSELADTYLEKAFAGSQDHLAGRCSLARSFLPSFFGATTKKMRTDSSTMRKRRRPTLPNNDRPAPDRLQQNVRTRNAAPQFEARARGAQTTLALHGRCAHVVADLLGRPSRQDWAASGLQTVCPRACRELAHPYAGRINRHHVS